MGQAAGAAGCLLLLVLILALIWPSRKTDMATAPKAPPKEPSDLEAALLTDTYIEGVPYRAGIVLRMSAKLAKAHEARGDVDLTEASIAARKAVGAAVITHAVPPAPSA